jgi:hypothetical protein
VVLLDGHDAAERGESGLQDGPREKRLVSQEVEVYRGWAWKGSVRADTGTRRHHPRHVGTICKRWATYRSLHSDPKASLATDHPECADVFVDPPECLDLIPESIVADTLLPMGLLYDLISSLARNPKTPRR